MTLSTTTNVNEYTGAGNTNIYAFTYPVFTSTDLELSIYGLDGTVYELILGTDYTVSGLIPAALAANTGTITLVNSGQAWLTAGNLTTGFVLNIIRVVPLTQDASIRNQGDFFPEVLENEFDYLMMAIQQLQTNIEDVQLNNVVLTDTITGFTYQLLVVNGVLSTQRLT